MCLETSARSGCRSLRCVIDSGVGQQKTRESPLSRAVHRRDDGNDNAVIKRACDTILPFF